MLRTPETMEKPNQKEIAANAVSLYQSLGPLPSSGNKRACVDVSDVSDDESVQVKRHRFRNNEHESGVAPFFYYRDFSREKDDDPLAPLTPPGRTANFPAKMHAMLSRTDVLDVVAWLPHGRAWRVLKPKVFAEKVAPSYFGHSKFTSFVRQANGWGFRRITNGPDRGAYYHERFLRGFPHLCKKMKRPGVAKKMIISPVHEPDLYRITEIFPLPEKASADDGILLESTFKKVRPVPKVATDTRDNFIKKNPRPVTPPSNSATPQSSQGSTPPSSNHPAHLPTPLEMHSAKPLGPVVRRSILPVPGGLCAFATLSQGAFQPVPVPVQVHQLLAGSIAPQALQSMFLGANQMVSNPLKGSPPALITSPQFAAGLAAPAVANSGGLGVLGQALIATSCSPLGFNIRSL